MMIKNKLYELQDLKYRDFSSSLLPGVNNIIGVRIPVLRKLSKQISLEELADDTFEEIMLQGMVIGHIQSFSLFEEECLKFLPKIDNWSVCDSFVSSLVITKNHKKEMFIFLKKLVFNTCPFTRRFVLVMVLKYYMEVEYLEEILDILLVIKKDEYYVEMAYAWCLAEMYYSYSDIVLKILEDDKYSIDISLLEKTVSKINDSKKISTSEKRKVQVLLNKRRR